MTFYDLLPAFVCLFVYMAASAVWMFKQSMLTDDLAERITELERESDARDDRPNGYAIGGKP